MEYPEQAVREGRFRIDLYHRFFSAWSIYACRRCGSAAATCACSSSTYLRGAFNRLAFQSHPDGAAVYGDAGNVRVAGGERLWS